MNRGFAAFPVQDRLRMAWAVVCGKALAQHAIVTGYDPSGILHVEVCDSVWLKQLEDMRGHLQAELARMAGVKVAELHFIVRESRRATLYSEEAGAE